MRLLVLLTWAAAVRAQGGFFDLSQGLPEGIVTVCRETAGTVRGVWTEEDAGDFTLGDTPGPAKGTKVFKSQEGVDSCFGLSGYHFIEKDFTIKALVYVPVTNGDTKLQFYFSGQGTNGMTAFFTASPRNAGWQVIERTLPDQDEIEGLPFPGPYEVSISTYAVTSPYVVFSWFSISKKEMPPVDDVCTLATRGQRLTSGTQLNRAAANIRTSRPADIAAAKDRARRALLSLAAKREEARRSKLRARGQGT